MSMDKILPPELAAKEINESRDMCDEYLVDFGRMAESWCKERGLDVTDSLVLMLEFASRIMVMNRALAKRKRIM